MNKEEIHKASIGNPCDANWQVEDIRGVACYISCRNCGTVLQSGCTPKCLKAEEPKATPMWSAKDHNDPLFFNY